MKTAMTDVQDEDDDAVQVSVAVNVDEEGVKDEKQGTWSEHDEVTQNEVE